ncbi:MAG: Asp-tRNA(Asn)/Glu-tRNA(Gln) amidotransferase subunit GatA [Gammaproteobacteria bacterium]|nr:Asp-tRNA(Asn)/Glu-tRNA(Gln) amidotransferase subunit GatA [Gammaproteobacteria bacterium]
MHNLTIAELSAGLRARKYSSEELTRAFLERIARFNPELNCFITVTPERALADARAADALLAKGEGGPLTGIPIAHKDIFCTEGIKTSCGSRMLDNFIAPYESNVAAQLKQAGTVLLGKTNMDEFAMGSSNETSFYGAVKNPWDRDAVPGGSSGGSAAAVAARLTPAATGTDTGGSIRQPAGCCGVTGLKPTYGRVSRYGMIAFASSLDQGGPLARSAEDAALMLNAMAGFDKRDSTSVDRPVPDFSKSLNDELAGMKIGLPRQWFNEGLHSDVAKAVEAAIKEFEGLGAKTVEVDLPGGNLCIASYYVIATAEASSNLARYDGVRFGHRCEDPKDLKDLYTRSRGEGFGAEVKRRIMIGTYVLSTGYYDAYYLKAQKVRRLIADSFRTAFENCDVIMGPVTPTVAFNLDEKLNDPVTMYLSDIYTLPVNLAGVPGICIPAGFGKKNRPVGLQIIGDYWQEGSILNVAHRYQQRTAWHKKKLDG